MPRFDVHVAVAQARNDVAALGVDDFCVIADAVRCVWSAIGKAAFADGDVVVFQGFAGVHVDPSAALDHQISGLAPRSGCDKFRCGGGPCGKVCVHPPVFHQPDGGVQEETDQIG